MFFLIRSLSFTLRQESETQLPLTREDECVSVDDVLDLSECKVSGKCFYKCMLLSDGHPSGKKSRNLKVTREKSGEMCSCLWLVDVCLCNRHKIHRAVKPDNLYQ